MIEVAKNLVEYYRNDMEETRMERRVPVLTIVAGLLLTFFLFSSIGFVALFFTGASLGYAWTVLAVAAILGVGALILTILSKREGRKKVWIPLLVGTVLLLQIDALGFAVISFRQGVEDNHRSYAQIATSRATIEAVRDCIPTRNLSLHTPQTKELAYACLDDDGKIVEKFLSLQFTLTSSGCYDWRKPGPYSDYYFTLTSDLELDFDSDFHHLQIYFQYESGIMTGGPYLGWNRYSIDPGEGETLKAVIDDKVEQQKRAHVQ